ncbi:hypothetical protein PMI29_04466 [Pseudomonas sp. GM49]|uniref:hypothetical protein n=1 Tax=Pseudomonas sp. GM49 TaxID=1144331 RepID=UPI0002700F07|nr:hypothetical protein [Pseudomonas sp. GM49]EJM58732.1 hypothetical protein PMI29_04466 [Pseudomonas sp. GM49]
MYEFLLERRHFDYLKDYFDFLGDLPEALEKFVRLISLYVGDGNVMTTSDINKLRALLSSSRDYIQKFDGDISVLDTGLLDTLSIFSTFTDECEAIASISPEKRYLQIKYLDLKQFCLPVSQGWKCHFPSGAVCALTDGFSTRLYLFGIKVSDLKFSIKKLHEGIHSIFVRFVRCLHRRMSCCNNFSYLERCYLFGWGGFRGAFAFIPYESRDARAAQARQHLREISLIYTAASSAINNLNDFFFAMLRFIEMAQQELVSIRETMKLSQLLLILSEVSDRLQEVHGMIRTLQQWSRK